MVTQLRDYRIVPGAMDAWIAEWRRQIVPIRRAVGFTVSAAWVVDEESRFVWLLTHPDGWEGFEQADAAYFAAPERKALDPDPARFIQEQHNVRLADVDLP
jgi:hypothetical protein